VEERLGMFAWSIISDIHSRIEFQDFDNPRLLTEITRLAALNLILSSRFSHIYGDLKSDEILLKCLSYEANHLGASERRVHEHVKQTIAMASMVPTEEIQKLSLNDFVNLLGWVHSLGSYRLPLSLRRGSLQRSLGAYYTPQAVADYIVSLTIKDDLERRVHAITKNGVSSFEDFHSVRILDPACGAGAFLISIANQIRLLSWVANEKARAVGVPQSDIDDILSHCKPKLYGVDLDPGALEVADISLRILDNKTANQFPPSMVGKNLKKGNSLISFQGLQGESNHQHFFQDPSSIEAFEWPLEFPEVFSDFRNGFDYIVMNPPYERLKPNLAEFIRERLASGVREIHTDLYEANKRSICESTNYYRESNEYQFATSYSINTYQLFIERALQLARENGNVGCIVPSNILGDVSAQRLRAHLLQDNCLLTIDDFPETSRIFPGITQSVSIITIKKGGETDDLEVGFNRVSLEDALEKKRMKIRKDRILRSMGTTLTIPRIDAAGFKLLDMLHNHSPLGTFENILIRRGELDLTNNKNAISLNKTNTPLIRGSHIARYHLVESRHKSEYVKMSKFKKTLETSSRSKHISMNRIACQQVSNMGQRWRLKFTQIEPGTVLANSCNYIVTNGNESSSILNYYLGILNSELMNWRFQISNFNNHVSIRELQNLPFIEPNKNNKNMRTLQKAVLNLDYSNIEASVFAIYGFGVPQAKSILEMRRTPDDEKVQILRYLSKLLESI